MLELKLWQGFLLNAKEQLRDLKRDFHEQIGLPHRLDSGGILLQALNEQGGDPIEISNAAKSLLSELDQEDLLKESQKDFPKRDENQM